MIYARSNRYGLDDKIYFLQQAFQEDLPWFNIDGIVSSDISIYGRIYRNMDTEGRIYPEAYQSNEDYIRIFVDDTKIATIGFLPEQIRDVRLNGLNKANIDIICTVQLDKLFGSSIRDDERALLQFIEVLKEDNSLNSISQVKIGVQNVFTGFYTEDIKFNDMQPWFVFSVRVNVDYLSDLCN